MRRIIFLVLLVLSGCLGPYLGTLNPVLQGPTQTPSQTATFVPTATVTPTRKPTATPRIVSPTPSPILTNPSEYTVQAGDTIIGLAEKFNLPWGYLADANGLDNPDMIQVGQTLTIPVWPPKDDGREIYVILSQQKAYAIENGKIVHEFVVSTGVPAHPTVTGRYKIYVKYRFDDMSGPGYYIKDVPFVMYFFQGYGLHGTFWHNNFGTPMSHGCVNLTVEDAEWLFDWASVGTPVVVVE